MIGTVLDHTYRVLERIGAGAMGEVFLVEHIHIGRREAIKVLRPEMAADPRLASRFRREARAINRLRHANIIGIYDFGQLPDGRLYLTMEYAGGVALDQALRRERRFELPRALVILHQLAAAIDHAHSHGVMHRDLKPNNLMLLGERGRSETVKVLDFGLAKVLDPQRGGDELTLQGELFGTPEYMAPERLAGKDDPRSDLYAIGCIAHELVTGAPPFTGNRALVMAAHLHTSPAALSSVKIPGVASVPPVFEALVLAMLAKDPDRRPSSGKAICAALETVPGFPLKRPPRTGMFQAVGEREPEEVTHRDRSRAPRPIAYADTANAQSEDVRDEILTALRDLAKVTASQWPGDDALTAAVATVNAALERRQRVASERLALEERQAEAVQHAREREGSLRFAIADLRFERQKAHQAVQPVGDLDYQIGQLEARVKDVAGGLDAARGARQSGRRDRRAVPDHRRRVRRADLTPAPTPATATTSTPRLNDHVDVDDPVVEIVDVIVDRDGDGDVSRGPRRRRCRGAT
ncbi:MAG: serine/threonine protein kinase [Deltaproteobacteria bacterium]|nr:serine/threonine protein kinase [Deltaproteobacteria bacterium]